MLIIDAHQDIAYNALEWGRDIRPATQETREREAREHPDYANANASGGVWMSGLPELKRGSFGLVFGTLFAYPQAAACTEVSCQYGQTQAYQNAEQAWQVARQQLAYYEQLASEPETGVRLIRTQSNLRQLWQDLNAAGQTTANERPLGIVLAMEGADPIRTPGEVEEWYRAGLRLIGPAWATGSRYAGGNSTTASLTSAGHELLREMQRLRMILDVSHLSDASFWEAIKSYDGPVIASHSNCRTLVAGQRNLSDEMIRVLSERNGVIGLALFNAFLVPNWSRTQAFHVGLEAVVEHIDHICQLTGSAEHVGVGSDFDGGFGRDETPAELDTVADLPRLAEALQRRGYREAEVLKIMSGNWLRVLQRALPESEG